MLAVRIGKSSVGEVKVLNAPGGLSACFVMFTLAEKHQFKAVPFTSRGGHITRVIPPFSAEILMLEMISRKLIRIAGESLAVVEVGRQRKNAEKNGQKPQEPAYRSMLVIESQ